MTHPYMAWSVADPEEAEELGRAAAVPRK